MIRTHGFRIVIASVVVTAGLGSVPATARSQNTAQEILRTAREHYEKRMEGIENYTVVQSMSGVKSATYFERAQTDDGRPFFRQRTSLELSQERSKESANPFLEQGGRGMAAGVADPSALFDDLAPRAELQGREAVAGREAYVISIDDLSGIDLAGAEGADATGQSSEPRFQPRSLRLWLDQEQYVTLRTVMTGILQMEGEEREVSFDARLGDYREVSGMLHPFHTEVSIEGIAAALTSEQQAQLTQAQKQLQEQLAKMDPAQRAMVERMMKDRMPDMEAMADSGAMTITIDVEELRVNDGPPPGTAPLGPPDVQPSGEPAGQRPEQPAGISPRELTPEYLEGEWCTRGFEPAIFRFYEDGSYHMALAEQLRVDTSAPPTSYEDFLESLKDARISEKTQDGFTVMRGGRESRWLRDCKEEGP